MIPAHTSTRLPTADVVICAYDMVRWPQLQRAVESVQQQTVLPGKIIVCVDHNEALAARCATKWPGGRAEPVPVVVLQNRFAGRLGSARNTALEAVAAEVVAFLDDDAVAETTWLERLLRVYAETGAKAVGGAPRPDFVTQRPVWFPDEFDWVFGCHHAGVPDHRAPARHLIGASMSADVEALRAVGGFHSDNHDDMDLSHRIAAAHGPGSVFYEPHACVHHTVPSERVTWRYFWRRCYTVNRGKVRAFSDLGEAGNLSAEREFVWRMTRAVSSRLARALLGRGAHLLEAGAIVAGVALAAAGHVHGKADLRLGRAPESLTRGLPQRRSVA